MHFTLSRLYVEGSDDQTEPCLLGREQPSLGGPTPDLWLPPGQVFGANLGFGKGTGGGGGSGAAGRPGMTERFTKRIGELLRVACCFRVCGGIDGEEGAVIETWQKRAPNAQLGAPDGRPTHGSEQIQPMGASSVQF